MSKFLCALFLGLYLTAAQATEIQQEDTINDRSAAIQAADPSNTDPEKFSNLVKSTMDLLGPSLEISQATEQTGTKSAE